jgi:hypothetical protein
MLQCIGLITTEGNASFNAVQGLWYGLGERSLEEGVAIE